MMVDRIEVNKHFEMTYPEVAAKNKNKSNLTGSNLYQGSVKFSHHKNNESNKC